MIMNLSGHYTWEFCAGRMTYSDVLQDIRAGRALTSQGELTNFTYFCIALVNIVLPLMLR